MTELARDPFAASRELAARRYRTAQSGRQKARCRREGRVPRSSASVAHRCRVGTPSVHPAVLRERCRPPAGASVRRRLLREAPGTLSILCSFFSDSSLLRLCLAYEADIRIRDAINNDIEIAINPDDVLVYDRPIRAHGIRRRDLQERWKETRRISADSEAKSAADRPPRALRRVCPWRSR